MRIRKNRRLRTQENRITDISMTPLIDTALTLLIIFMITAPMLQNAIKVTLPQGQAKEDASHKQEELVVYVDKVGDFYIDKIKINKTDVIAHITKIVGDDKEKTVYVKADTAVSYGTVLTLVDDIKFVGGIKYVALATQKHSQTAPSLG